VTARIVIFAKAPVSGKVKTRLIPALGAEGAAAMARQMLQRTVEEATASGLDVELCADPHPDHADWLGRLPPIDVSWQGKGDLGVRLARATQRVIAEGDRPIVIGTDCPELSRETLRAAAKRLEGFDAVINPAEDGGYALIGLRRFDPSLFQGIAWSTSTVAEATIDRIRALGWTLHIGETLRDIDEPADLL